MPSPYVVMWIEPTMTRGQKRGNNSEAQSIDESKDILIETKEGSKQLRIPMDSIQVWPVRHDCTEAVWRSTKPVITWSGKCNPKSDKLHIAVFDYSHPQGEDIIGYTTIRIRQLATEVLTEVTIPLAYTPVPFFPANCIISLKLGKPAPMRKTIFLVRHAKSLWNYARETDLGVSAVFSEDHGLHGEGFKEAEALRTQIKLYASGDAKTTNEKRQEYTQEFLECDSILCSPLSRAVQTAVVIFQDHPHVLRSRENPSENVVPESFAKRGLKQPANTPIKLMSSIRERRNFGSRDCVSKYRGHAILRHSQKHLNKYYGPNATEPYVLSGAQRRSLKLSCGDLIDVNDCTDKWWDDDVETKSQFDSRMQQFMEYLQYCPHRKIIVVGHSMWIQNFLVDHVSDELRSRIPEIASEKIENCGVLACDTVFNAQSSDPEATVEDIELLFSTSFKSNSLRRVCTSDIRLKRPQTGTTRKAHENTSEFRYEGR